VVVPAVANLSEAVGPSVDLQSDAALRAELAGLLRSGLATDWQGRAYSSADVQNVVARLRQVGPGDRAALLAVAGFTDQPYRVAGDEIEQSCASCMYFERHRQYCNLPEIALPVEAGWSCVLWRI
jgi:hypothetical protein